MKKIFSLILAILTLSTVLASCGNETVIAPDGMKLVSGDDCAYNLFVPESWEIINGYGTYGAYTSDASNVSVSTFTATDIGNKKPEGTTGADETTEAPAVTDAPDMTEAPTNKTEREQYIDAYWAMCEKSYTEDLNGFAVVEAGKETALGGLLAKQYEYTAKYEGISYKMQMTVTYSGGIMYILTYTAKADNYDVHKAETEKIVSEFKFK